MIALPGAVWIDGRRLLTKGNWMYFLIVSELFYSVFYICKC